VSALTADGVPFDRLSAHTTRTGPFRAGSGLINARSGCIRGSSGRIPHSSFMLEAWS
jgi:hypothetical protein